MVRFADLRRGTRSTTEVAQRAQQFVNNAFDTDRRNTRWVSLARIVPTRRGWRCITITKVRGERARRHVQLVHMPPDFRGRFRSCQRIRIDCDCGRHVFVWNHALFEAGLAVVDRTNGEPADITNPAGALGCCKHGIVDLRYLIRANPAFPHADQSRASTIATPVQLSTIRRARQVREA